MSEYVVTLGPVYMESSGEHLGSTRLRRFQKELADIEDGVIALSAPTGSGKTVALLTDRERGTAVGLYPNNELLCSQVAGLHNFIIKYLGMKPESTLLLDYCRKGELAESYPPLNVYASDNVVNVLGRRINKIYVAGMSGEVIKGTADRGKLDILIEVSDKLVKVGENGYNIVLATPDTFFLLALYVYRNFSTVGRFIHYLISRNDDIPATYSHLEKLMRELGIVRSELDKIVRAFIPFRRSTIFVDEYHLYGFYELSSFKALLYVLTRAHGWEGRLVLSSATPSVMFQEEVAKELGIKLAHVDGISQVKEKGDAEELVRGSLQLVFTGLSTGGKNKVSRLFKSSEQAYELLSTEHFKKFMKLYSEGSGRGMIILEKVSHAELFAERLYGKSGVKPLCVYSMPREDVCAETLIPDTRGALLIVGTGAKIGQGVEYPGVTFGIIARVSSPDFLQSLSRIGRKHQGESAVLVPLDEKDLEEVEESPVFSKGKVTYLELAKWVEEDGKPYMRKVPSGFEKLYSSLVSSRENLLKLAGLALHYRLSGAYYEDLGKCITQYRSGLDDLRILSAPDYLYTLLMFRSSGPSVTYCRYVNGEVNCYERGEDLGTIIRNYEVGADDGRLVIKGIGRGEVDVVCENVQLLESMVKSQKLMLIGWTVLKGWFRCRLVAGSWDSKELERLAIVERGLEDQLFLASNLMNDELAEYVYRTGRGLRVKLNKGSIMLLYV